MVNPTCRDGQMYPPPLSDCKKSRCNRGERRSTRTSRGPYGTFERIQSVSVHREKNPRSFSPCEPLLASHMKTRRRCWRRATHERGRFCAVASVHCWAGNLHLQCSCPNHCFPSPRLRQPPQLLLQTPAFVALIQHWQQKCARASQVSLRRISRLT